MTTDLIEYNPVDHMSEDDWLWQLIRSADAKYNDPGLLIQLGWHVQHNSDSRKSHRGFPDITAWKGDRLIFAELKRQTGWKWGKGHIETLDELQATGAEVYLWRPRDWECVVDILQTLDLVCGGTWREWFGNHTHHKLTKGQRIDQGG